jgi:hypothetical protein
MVPALQLTEEEVLEHLRKVLKEVTIVPHVIPEYYGDNPPPVVSCFTEYFFYNSFVVGTFHLQFSAYSFSFGCFCRNWGVTLLIRFPLMITQLVRGAEQV